MSSGVEGGGGGKSRRDVWPWDLLEWRRFSCPLVSYWGSEGIHGVVIAGVGMKRRLTDVVSRLVEWEGRGFAPVLSGTRERA